MRITWRALVALCCLVASFIGAPASALAEELTAAADAYVRLGAPTTNYNETQLLVKSANAGTSVNTRKAFIRFVRTSTAHADVAFLRFAVTTFDNTSGATSADFYLWGIKDSHAAEDFSETGVTHGTYPDILDSSDDGTVNNSAGLYDGDPDVSGVQPLGVFTVIEANLNHAIVVTAPHLADFINASTDSTITFLITRKTDSSMNTGFASRESTSLSGPQLSINPPPPVELHKVTGVTDGFKSMGLTSGALSSGTLIGQTVTTVGSDPGTLRMNTSGQIKYQESDNGAHTSGETADVVAFLTDLTPNGIPMETGSFTMGMSNASQSTTVSADADAYVRYNDSTNYGGDAQLLVKKSGGGAGSTVRKAFVRFTIPSARTVSAATLRFSVSMYSNGGTPPDSTYYVWGIKDATDAEDFDEMSVTHSTYSVLDTSSDGTNNSVDDLYDGDSGASGAQALGTFTVHSSDLNGQVTFTSAALRDFLATDTTGTVTILLTRDTDDGQLNSGFASRENGSLPGPQLDMTYVADNIHEVTFAHEYVNPVVFAQPVTYNGSDPIAVFPVFTTTDGAVFQMAEGPSYDQNHGAETVHYAVFEAGFYHVNDTLFLDVGLNSVTTSTYNNSTGMTQLATRGALFKDTASLLVQSQSAILDGYQGTRVSKVTSGGNLTGFKVRHMLDLPRESSGTTAASSSFMGWLVIGEATPYGNPGDPELWSFDGGSGGGSSSSSSNTSAATCGGGAQYSNMLYTEADDEGNSTFGADYSFQAGVTSSPSNWAGVKGDANVTLFSQNVSVIDVGAEITDTSNKAWLSVLGHTYVSKTGNYTVADPALTVTLLSASTTFFGATIHGEIDGAIGMTADVSVGTSGTTLSATPYANVTGEASASIGGACLSASIHGEVTLFETSIPNTFTVNWTSGAWSADTKMTLTSLSGDVYLKLSYCIGSKKKTLFSWDGVLNDYAVWDKTASGCLW